MKTLWWKLSLLYHFIKWAIIDWRLSIWQHHPDECYSCEKIDCRCGGFIAGEGMTLRQVYAAEVYKTDGYIQVPEHFEDDKMSKAILSLLEHRDD